MSPTPLQHPAAFAPSGLAASSRSFVEPKQNPHFCQTAFSRFSIVNRIFAAADAASSSYFAVCRL
jgi:hypothetical protein